MTATTPSAQWVATISQPRLSFPLKEELACTLHVEHTTKPSEPGTSPDIHSQQIDQKTVLWANITHPASPHVPPLPTLDILQKNIASPSKWQTGCSCTKLPNSPVALPPIFHGSTTTLEWRQNHEV